MIAHSWALKHWDLKGEFTIDEFIDGQLELILAGLRPKPAR